MTLDILHLLRLAHRNELLATTLNLIFVHAEELAVVLEGVTVGSVFVLLEVRQVLRTGAEADSCETVIIDNEGLDDGVGDLDGRIWYIACNVGDSLWMR